ncbi:MAG TPA: hypothetical protein VK425_04970 [Acidimicrobiales bacterium]|nr:hypothetical protein [Acidimicrobiales bacterium]
MSSSAFAGAQVLGGPARGRVVCFDAEVGLGEVRSEGGVNFPFHCTEIMDGSRDIAVGAEVSFCVAPGHRGRWEATAVGPSGG